MWGGGGGRDARVVYAHTYPPTPHACRLMTTLARARTWTCTCTSRLQARIRTPHRHVHKRIPVHGMPQGHMLPQHGGLAMLQVRVLMPLIAQPCMWPPQVSNVPNEQQFQHTQTACMPQPQPFISGSAIHYDRPLQTYGHGSMAVAACGARMHHDVETQVPCCCLMLCP